MLFTFLKIFKNIWSNCKCGENAFSSLSSGPAPIPTQLETFICGSNANIFYQIQSRKENIYIWFVWRIWFLSWTRRFPGILKIPTTLKAQKATTTCPISFPQVLSLSGWWRGGGGFRMGRRNESIQCSIDVLLWTTKNIQTSPFVWGLLFQIEDRQEIIGVEPDGC